MEASSEKSTFDRDSDGVILPTMRNKEIFNNLSKQHQNPEGLQKLLGDDYIKILRSFVFDARNQNAFYVTGESARKAKKRSDFVNRLDQEWLSRKGNHSTKTK